MVTDRSNVTEKCLPAIDSRSEGNGEDSIRKENPYIGGHCTGLKEQI